jgi:predicted metal-binding membrane protein
VGATSIRRVFGDFAPSATVVALFATVVVLAWVAVFTTATNLNNVLMVQLSGAAPVDRFTFLALVGVMMGAMMLPSALPMLSVYRGLSTLDSNRRESAVRTTIFSSTYLLLWLAFTGAALVVLLALGLLGTLSGVGLLVPGLLLVGAGAYQFTSWKSFCLTQCRTPVGFVLEHWRTGRKGAAQMGFAHAAYCLGCCWVLMIVVFVTGAMSLLWMAGFSGLVLVEKVWSRGDLFARVIGGVALVAGIAVTAWVGLTGGIL